MNSYPAVLIGRLGVNKDYRTTDEIGNTTGNQLMNFIKTWFLINNKTGCRFIVVDSYNTEKALKYYERNGFQPLFSNEEQEKQYYSYSTEKPLESRLLYFDLISYKY